MRMGDGAEQTLFSQIETNINWKIASRNLKPANCITIQKTKKELPNIQSGLRNVKDNLKVKDELKTF